MCTSGPGAGWLTDEASAAEAVTALEKAGSFWHKLLEALPAEAWSEKLVLHQLDEQIHHGAELGVLRDLYRWQP
jgi:hypothetical protein